MPTISHPSISKQLRLALLLALLPKGLRPEGDLVHAKRLGELVVLEVELLAHRVERARRLARLDLAEREALRRRIDLSVLLPIGSGRSMLDSPLPLGLSQKGGGHVGVAGAF